MRPPFAALLLLAYGAEVPLTALRTEPVIESATSLAIAGTRRGTVVVWNGTRPQAGAYMARFDEGGRRLDPTDVRIGPEGAAAVATDGDEYVVVSGHCSDMEVRWIAADDAIESPATIPGVPACSFPDVATNGETALAVAGGQAVLIARDNSIVARPVLGWTVEDRARVASNGDGYAVAIRQANEVRVVQLSRRGEVLSEEVIAATAAASMDIESDGRDYVVAWTDAGIHAQRLGGPRMSIAPYTNVPSLALAWTGAEYALVFGDANGDVVRRARLTRHGAVIATDVVAAADPSLPLVAAAQESVIWRGADGMLLRDGGTPVSSAAAMQTVPVVVDTPQGPIVLWRGRGGEVRGMAVDGSEHPLGISARVSAGFDGAHLVVAWIDAGTLSVRRYTTALAPVDAPRVLSTGATSVSVGGGDGAVLIVWSEDDVKSVLLRPTDSGIPPPRTVAATPGSDGSPAVAWNGTRFLVAWSTAAGIVAVRADANGLTIDPVPLTLRARGAGELSAASNGADFYVVWRESGALRGRRVGNESLGSEDVLRGDPYMRGRPVVRATPSGAYVAAWTHQYFAGRAWQSEVEWCVIGPGGLGPWRSLPAGSLREEIAWMGAEVVYARASAEWGGTWRLFRRALEQQPQRCRSVR